MPPQMRAVTSRSAVQVATNQYINTAWGIGVFVGVLVAYDVTGAHLNPAVSYLTACMSSELHGA